MTSAGSECSESLAGQRVALVGRLAGMSKREAAELIRRQGGTPLERPDASATLVVVGEVESNARPAWQDTLDDAARDAIGRGAIAITSESQFWQRLGLVHREPHIHSLHTPASLAGLLGTSTSTIRRWQRRGWIVASREVRRLAYFDFREVATARRLAELSAAGMTPAAIDKTLQALARQLPDVERPLAELSIVVEGKRLLVRRQDGLVEPGGQLRFDFGATADSSDDDSADVRAANVLAFVDHEPPGTPDDFIQAAEQLEDQGDPESASEMYRAALAAGGPRAEICFRLAELLYQAGQVEAARERSYMAIELDEDYVEARANLGCVLAELGQCELAASALEGALALHDDYADAHYHLGRTLDLLGRSDEATTHWQAFLRLAPSSPWADEARQRLGQSGPTVR